MSPYKLISLGPLREFELKGAMFSVQIILFDTSVTSILVHLP